jgi:hypothetical protein
VDRLPLSPGLLGWVVQGMAVSELSQTSWGVLEGIAVIVGVGAMLAIGLLPILIAARRGIGRTGLWVILLTVLGFATLGTTWIVALWLALTSKPLADRPAA